jgi:type I restriction enzyme, S subunit
MNVPRLRFKEFSEEWEVKKLNEITSYVDYRGKTPEKSDSGVFLVTAKNICFGYTPRGRNFGSQLSQNIVKST